MLLSASRPPPRSAASGRGEHLGLVLVEAAREVGGVGSRRSASAAAVSSGEQPSSVAARSPRSSHHNASTRAGGYGERQADRQPRSAGALMA